LNGCQCSRLAFSFTVLSIKTKMPVGRYPMGTLIFFGVIVLGLCPGIVIISLLYMAPKGEQVYEYSDRGETIATAADTYYLPASETLSPTSGGKARPLRDFSASAVAP
jgi:hypothetical protein